MTETALIDTAMDTALATVRGASVLNADDAANLDRLAPELRQTWETAQVFRTRTEMEMSVLNDLHFPTPDSKYWQCVREQNVMFGEMVGLSFEYRKNRVEQLKELRKIEGETDPLARELHQIELDRLRYIGANMERVAKDRMREIQHWHEIKASRMSMRINASRCRFVPRARRRWSMTTRRPPMPATCSASISPRRPG